MSAALENDTSGSVLPPSVPISDPSSGPPGKRPTGIKTTLGYNPKPKRFTGLKVLAFFAAAVLVIMSVRLLAVPGGGPFAEAYRFVQGIFFGTPAENAAAPNED